MDTYPPVDKPVTKHDLEKQLPKTLESATDVSKLSYTSPEVKPLSFDINTVVYSAHSTRGASTTAAVKQGVSIADILKTADWSKESTFKRFYYRPENDASFAHKVLGVQPEH